MSTNALDQQTQDTLEAIAKAQTTGILEATGAYSYDLTGLVRLIPVLTPFREQVAREQSPNGNPFATWRAFMNVNSSQPRATPGFDYAGNEVVFQEQDFQAAYQPIALAGLVTQDSFDLAKGLYDPYAEATMQVLNQTLIAEDKLLIGAQNFALPVPPAPTLSSASTGGSLGTSAVYVGVAARTASGYFYGGNSQGNSANISPAAGTTNTVTATIPAVKGAVAYDWFYSANGTSWYYLRTTTVASTTITATIAANQSPASTTLPGISTVVPTYKSSGDNGSGQANEFNGLIASLTGDYLTSGGAFTTPGSGTANPAIFVDGGGAALTLSGGSVSQITNLLASLWAQCYVSPSALMMNAIQAQEIANLVLAQPSAVTFLQTDEAGRINVTAGARVGQVVNVAAGGVTVPLEVHPNLPPGTIIARTDRIPFPQANISTPLAVRTLRDYSQFEYATNRVAGSAGGGPRKEFEIRSVEAFINRAPVAMGILTNVA